MKSKKDLKVVIGLGKTGFSLVEHLRKLGCEVAVVDSRTDPPKLTELRRDFPEVPTFLGSFSAKILDEATDLVISPGVSLREPEIQKQIKRGAKYYGDIELFARSAKAPIVAITGTNGKSTTTSLVGEMAKAAGLNTGVGGNLGTPALDLLRDDAEIYVLELSSFQLELVNAMNAKVATILNVTEDHMDRYQSFNEYLTAKQRVFIGASAAVLNLDDKASFAHATLPKKLISFSLQNSAADFYFEDDAIKHKGKKLLSINELKIKGLHNVANVLAAISLGSAINLPLSVMLDTARCFPGLRHRCQWVSDINGVSWYNDTKATNVGSTIATVEGLGKAIKGKVILIAGGLGKGADFSELSEPVARFVRAVVLIGKDRDKIAKSLAASTKIVYADSMQQAVELCAELAKPEDAVLLAPACASFDMFKDFQHRGEVFEAEVKRLSSKH